MTRETAKKAVLIDNELIKISNMQSYINDGLRIVYGSEFYDIKRYNDDTGFSRNFTKFLESEKKRLESELKKL